MFEVKKTSKIYIFYWKQQLWKYDNLNFTVLYNKEFNKKKIKSKCPHYRMDITKIGWYIDWFYGVHKRIGNISST